MTETPPRPTASFGDLESRRGQMFPTLTPAQIKAALRFAGPTQRFGPNQTVFELGARGAAAHIILTGSLVMISRDASGGEVEIVTYGPNQISGEVAQLAGRPSLVEARAGPEGCELAAMDAAHVRDLMVAEAELGEHLMRAYILRRWALLKSGVAGPILLGHPSSGAFVRLQGFLTRNSQPHTALDIETDEQARAIVERFRVAEADLPIVLCTNGELLRRPTEAEVAACLGMLSGVDPDKVYDAAIVGAGPAGMACAVYSASEGLEVVILDERAYGGQAGASARIENYLGFPTGITGQALMARAFNQAQKFGAQFAIPVRVTSLDCGKRPFVLKTADNDITIRARAVVVASGARYRRLDVEGLENFEGEGVHYWASPVEAKLCQGEEVVLVGGGNSAGQAAVFLAGRAAKVHVMARRPLAQTMSAYLVERLEANPRIAIHIGREVGELKADERGALCCVGWRDRSGETGHTEARHLFLFIGADPNSGWIETCGVDVDPKGFVITGTVDPAQGPLATNIPGVFALGDVRCGSTKRIAAAVGEGAAATAMLHAWLAELGAEAEAPAT